ncbi:MAG: hypothetical protein HFF00_06035 [Ruminiclostridium sp.]|jgi:hypothetical protein|nr:hypothetical protein [Ruminiclostridium sp.]
MKKKTVRTIVIAALLTAAALLFLNGFLPRSFATSLDLDPEEVELVQVTLLSVVTDGSKVFDLTPEDPSYHDLWTLLDSHRYRPKFPPSTKSYGSMSLFQDPQYLTATLTFLQDELPYSLSFNGQEDLFLWSINRPLYWRPIFNIVDLDQDSSRDFQQAVFDLLLEAAPAEASLS